MIMATNPTTTRAMAEIHTALLAAHFPSSIFLARPPLMSEENGATVVPVHEELVE
jgi:hypothetical protein